MSNKKENIINKRNKAKKGLNPLAQKYGSGKLIQQETNKNQVGSKIIGTPTVEDLLRERGLRPPPIKSKIDDKRVTPVIRKSANEPIRNMKNNKGLNFKQQGGSLVNKLQGSLRQKAAEKGNHVEIIKSNLSESQNDCSRNCKDKFTSDKNFADKELVDPNKNSKPNKPKGNENLDEISEQSLISPAPPEQSQKVIFPEPP